MRRSRDLAERFFKRAHACYCTVDSALPDEKVAVKGYYQPREDDTNTAEAVEIEEVMHLGVDKREMFADSELQEFADELLAKFHSYCEAYYEGDG